MITKILSSSEVRKKAEEHKQKLNNFSTNKVSDNVIREIEEANKLKLYWMFVETMNLCNKALLSANNCENISKEFYKTYFQKLISENEEALPKIEKIEDKKFLENMNEFLKFKIEQIDKIYG